MGGLLGGLAISAIPSAPGHSGSSSLDVQTTREEVGSSFNLPQFITCLAFLLSISRIAILPPTRRAALPLQSCNGGYMPERVRFESP